MRIYAKRKEGYDKIFLIISFPLHYISFSFSFIAVFLVSVFRTRGNEIITLKRSPFSVQIEIEGASLERREIFCNGQTKSASFRAS